MNIFMTGAKGYLGKHLVKELGSVYCSEEDVYTLNQNINNYDLVIHFASPSEDFEFKDDNKTYRTIVQGTSNIVRLCKLYNKPLLYASSLAADLPENTICNYGRYKKIAEYIIQHSGINYKILKIPRVYSKDREKGLMRKIRLGLIKEEDLNNKIEYIELEEFIKETLENINIDNSNYYYRNIIYSTLNEIIIKFKE